MIKNKIMQHKVIIGIVIAAISIALLVSSSFAYFRAFVDSGGVNSMMVELIFDRLDFTDSAIENDANYNPEATWGTEQNPYVISQKYHVQNLSVLQNSGFFVNRVDANGEPIQAHFLVCTPQGLPVAIDCGGMTLSPVGTHELPFTGVIKGAPYDGETTYSGYGTSTSTIANLTVQTSLSEPDIGFFGRLGYHGTKGTNADTGAPTLTGYAAVVEDLVLADVTIKSRFSLGQTLAEWWAAITGSAEHLNRKDESFESHHVGIIAGHAEFATINNVSVFYSSDSVEAFDLVSSNTSETSYYSSTGLLGLLDCVNPVKGDNGVLDGSNSISDSDLVGDGSTGGGGDESGTMTGYFLAKNLFDRHEDYLSTQIITTKDKYSVTEMKDADGGELFKSVTMRERTEIGVNNWKYYNYFYFQDTVFTFAMTTKVPANQNGNVTGDPVDNAIDYVQKIWVIDENSRPAISSAETLDNLQYGPDPTATPPISYRLKATGTLTNNAYYVLAYHDKDAKCLYIIDMTDTTGSRNYTRKIPLENNEEEVLEIGYAENTDDIATINLKGIEREVYDYSFQYVSDGDTAIIKRSDYKLGITSGTVNGSKYESASTAVSKAAHSGGDYNGSDAFVYNWKFTKAADSNKFRITGQCTFGGRRLLIFSYFRYYWSALKFNAVSESIGFDNKVFQDEGERNSDLENASFDDTNYFTIFEVKANTLDDAGNITNEDDTGNKLLASKNIFPDEDFYDFDPSKYVLQFVEGDENTTADDSYKLVPIRSLKLNNGQGDLLEELNHIVKLSKTTPDNFQLTIGAGLGLDGLDDWFGLNSGGVVNTTIGTFDNNSYSIPTGMIAFQLNAATEENPSYINIIVAIEPDQESIGKVGLWKMNKSAWTSGFDITDPDDHFMLPVSKTATTAADLQYAIKISERVVESEIEGKKIYNTVLDANGNNETSYIYLGGDVALVYYTFKITDISDESVFMLGSGDGPLSVAYFSVTGAAGEGNDGMSGSPLGNVDFVYAFNNKIITTDKHYEGDAPLISLEDYEKYYPSYLFVGMLPGENNKIQQEVIYINRYISTSDSSGTKRHLRVVGESKAAVRGVSPIMQDVQDDLDDN